MAEDITNMLSKLSASAATTEDTAKDDTPKADASGDNPSEVTSSPVAVAPAIKQCAHCSSPAATFTCVGCIDAPAVDGSSQHDTVYCNKECQREHWPKHKDDCKRLRIRRTMFHAGDFLQKLWYIYRKAIWDVPLVMVEEKNGKLHLHQGDPNQMPLLHPNGYFCHFDESLFTNENDKAAALSFAASNQAVAWMEATMLWALKDTAAKIKEVRFNTSTSKRSTSMMNMQGRVDYSHYWPSYQQYAWKVHVKGGEVYALDITGAQYGFYAPVVEWSTYEDTRIYAALTPHAVGYAKQEYANAINMPSAETVRPRSVRMMRTQLCRGFDMAMKNSNITTHELAGFKMLQERGQKYHDLQATLLHCCQDLIVEVVRRGDLEWNFLLEQMDMLMKPMHTGHLADLMSSDAEVPFPAMERQNKKQLKKMARELGIYEEIKRQHG